MPFFNAQIRVYQDAQVIYTRVYTSAEPNPLPPMINKPSDWNGLLDLDPKEVVLYVGGYPEDFKVNKSTKELKNKANTFFD